jgi:NAD(P)-dependent dehydrogenase (short-subunit alcohol dehydrogenase family)
MRFDGKIAIVTGAAGGIGHGLVRAFAKAGAAVTVTDIDGPGAEKVSEELRGFGAQSIAVGADISDPAQVATVVDRTIAELGGVDILVNNAYYQPGWNSAEELAPEAFDRTMKVAAYGTFYLSQAVFPHMRARGGGKIVNFGSEMSDQPLHGRVAYASAKGAVRSMTHAFARDWGKFGINVNVIWPAALTPSTERYGREHPEDMVKIIQEISMNRLGDPENDIAPVILFLSSPESDWINGQTIGVNGGKTMI